MVFLVSTCDEWKSRDSMRPIGVFTSEKQLKKGIVSLFKDDYCNFEGVSLEKAKEEHSVRQISNEIKECDIDNLDSRLEYISIKSIEPNTLEV